MEDQISTTAVEGEPDGKCHALTKAGTPCKTRAVTGKSFCLFHGNPELARTLGRRGGQANRHIQPDPNAPELQPPTTAAQVRDALAKLFADACAGRVEPKVAQVAASLSGDLLKAIQVAADLEGGSKVEPQTTNSDDSCRLLDSQDWTALFGDPDISNPRPVTTDERITPYDFADATPVQTKQSQYPPSQTANETEVDGEEMDLSDGTAFMRWCLARDHSRAED